MKKVTGETEVKMKIVTYGNPSASTVFIQPVDDHDLGEMEIEIDEIRIAKGFAWVMKNNSVCI